MEEGRGGDTNKETGEGIQRRRGGEGIRRARREKGGKGIYKMGKKGAGGRMETYEAKWLGRLL